MFRHLSLAALLALVALPAAQAEEPRYNQISLRAEASREVPHDRMHVTLLREEQHSDPAQLAARITRALNAVRARTRAGPRCSSTSGPRRRRWAGSRRRSRAPAAAGPRASRSCCPRRWTS